MKFHKQQVIIEVFDGSLEVISFFDNMNSKYGADIYKNDELIFTLKNMEIEPMREHLLAIGFNYAAGSSKNLLSVREI